MGSSAAALPADIGASPAPAASPVPADAAPSPGVQQGSGAPSPGAAAESQNIRQLREAYDKLKGEYEPYSKLGKPEEIQTHVALATKIATRALEVGTALGYKETEIREALANDPDGTLAFLRQKQAEADKGTDPLQKVEQLLDKRLKPLEQERAQEKEQRVLSEAHTRFNTAFDEGMKTLFKDEMVPNEEADVLYEGALMLLRRDAEAVKRLREGKTSDVQKYLTDAKASLDKYHLSRSQREQKSAGGQPGKSKSTATPGKRPTLDDIINDTGLINKKYA